MRSSPRPSDRHVLVAAGSSAVVTATAWWLLVQAADAGGALATVSVIGLYGSLLLPSLLGYLLSRRSGATVIYFAAGVAAVIAIGIGVRIALDHSDLADSAKWWLAIIAAAIAFGLLYMTSWALRAARLLR